MARRILFVILAVLITLSAFGMPNGGPLENDPGNGTGGGGSCTYCSSTHCGCANAQVGYILYFSCTCSSLECTRSCTYEPRQP
jgi:hypothetical protein